MKVDFYLRFRTKFGQKLSIIGNFSNAGEEEILPMQFFSDDFWHISIEVDAKQIPALHYRYIFTNEYAEVTTEAERHRNIILQKVPQAHVVVMDTWNDAGFIENAFYTAPFKEVLLPKVKALKTKKAPSHTHIFKVKAPLLQQAEVVCLLGSTPELSDWNSAAPIKMEKMGDWWMAQIDLSNVEVPVAYKYGVYNTKDETFVAFEGGDNRTLQAAKGILHVLHDGFVQLPANVWRGAGVAIPVFSLRSANSFGVGEFADIKLLVDWAASVGMKLIQLLPVNDTTATFTWQDSYPYAAISAFALHPIYINLAKVAGKKNAKLVSVLGKKQKSLNALPELDYEKVMQFKMSALRELCEAGEGEFVKDEDFQKFYESNNHWLLPYAAFCFLRDKYGTADFSQWKTHSVFNQQEAERLASPKNKSYKQILFYYFIQYHLHLQLKEATDYAHKRGIVMKGDIPIGIYRYGADAWTAPELYNMDQQAGAPPDDFAVKGQNWGFPTYNWQRMQQNNFEWWRRRFEQMSHYFDTFRIDHILGFFRIWSIPTDAVEGIMGVFDPALPVHITEFGERGIWFDYDRYCKPYITDDVVAQLFGEHADFVKANFLLHNNRGGYDLQEAFDTQKKVEAYFSPQGENDETKKLKQGLFDLISNVILFEHKASEGREFHFRISIESTTSFQHLDEGTKGKIKDLYINYFYQRQDAFWKAEAMRKLPALKEATNMLICGEDLGMVPHSVPEVMKSLGILSLEIQRMPKGINVEFFHPQNAPYLSVITPSTHDMSTIRGWWEEDRTRTEKFFYTILQGTGYAPQTCEAWINRAIILQHLYAPAMWSIFQIQDILGMSETLRSNNVADERINNPANPKHYWRYRMHLPLEQLQKETEFNKELSDYILNSGR